MAMEHDERKAGASSEVTQPELWESELLTLIGQAEQVLTEARKVPLTGLVLADADAVGALLDHMRQVLPEDIRRARWIVSEEQRLIAEAEETARRTVAGADERLAELVNESEVKRAAEEQAAAIMARAEEMARDTRQAARRYVADLLARIESQAQDVAQRLEANRRELQD